jgi:hypothetical protein
MYHVLHSTMNVPLKLKLAKGALDELVIWIIASSYFLHGKILSNNFKYCR